MNILILKNIGREDPGILEELLLEKKIGHTIVDLDKGELLPEIEEYDALVVLGGPDSANDTTSKIIGELEYIRKALEKKIPYLGICLGMQLLVKACGGAVTSAPVKEIGFIDVYEKPYFVQLTNRGWLSPLFNGMNDTFEVFHLHGETVVLPEGVDLYGKGEHVKNQIVGYNDFAFGLQCHVELTEELFRTLLREDDELSGLDERMMTEYFSSVKESYTETGRMLFSNFLDFVRVFRGL